MKEKKIRDGCTLPLFSPIKKKKKGVEKTKTRARRHMEEKSGGLFGGVLRRRCTQRYKGVGHYKKNRGKKDRICESS